MHQQDGADRGADATSRMAPSVALASLDGLADREFLLLLDRHLDRSYRLARAILGNDADAEDAVQEAWASAWRGFRQLREPGRFEPWLNRIVANACRGLVRRRGPVRELAIEPDLEIRSVSPGPDEVVARDRVERAFAALSIEQRTILVLHHLEGRPLAAIADDLGIAVGTVKSRLYAARATLQRALEDDQ
jgi:RNA polymerase sigma-70 factor (ECF subfamily)